MMFNNGTVSMNTQPPASLKSAVNCDKLQISFDDSARLTRTAHVTGHARPATVELDRAVSSKLFKEEAKREKLGRNKSIQNMYNVHV